MPFALPFLLAMFWILDVIQWLGLVWVILSWIVFFARQSSFRWKHKQFFNILEQLDEILTRMTMPMLRPFRRILPPHQTAGLDSSPMLPLLALFPIRGLLAAALSSLSRA